MRIARVRNGTQAMANSLVRFSVAIGGELLRMFDRYRADHKYANRSEAVRGLMRSALIEDEVAHDESETMGVLTLIYDHHRGQIAERLTDIQHARLERVVTTTHVHLDPNRCLEVILLRGRARDVRELCDQLIGTKGVESGRLVLASASALSGPIPARARSHDHADGHSHARRPSRSHTRRDP